MLIPWNIANQQENKCSLHAASKKDNSPPLRAVQCTVQSKLLFNFRVTMFNSLWPFVQNRTRRFCIRTNHRYWIKAGISSPTKSFLSCNHRLHCSQSGQARKEHTGRLERDVLFCFVFVWNANIAISSSVSVWNQRQRLNDKTLQKAQWNQLLMSITWNCKL